LFSTFVQVLYKAFGLSCGLWANNKVFWRQQLTHFSHIIQGELLTMGSWSLYEVKDMELSTSYK
jgi:hypothetical protein